METLKIEKKGNYAIVELDNGKVNAINAQMGKDLKEAFEQLESDDSVKGVILSGRPHGVSAGLDVVSLAKGGEPYAKEFWINYLGAVQAMTRFSKPFVCAITGYAPAGATILALTADYRVMGKGEKHVIGMHEFKMNMLIPQPLCEIYSYHMGEKHAWEAVQQAKLFNSDEAKEVGLVNESVEVEEVLERAEKHLKRLLYITPITYRKSKQFLRSGLLSIVDYDIEKEIGKIAVDTKENPDMQLLLQMFVASLKK